MQFAKWSRVSAVLFAAGILAMVVAALPDYVQAQSRNADCYPAPEIYSQPQDVTVGQGSSARLAVSANAFDVKWFRGNVGDRSAQVAATAVYDTGPLTATTKYWAEISNSCGTVSTRQVTVTVNTFSRTPGPCVASATVACLLNGRFEAKIDFVNQFAVPPAPGTFKAARVLSTPSVNPDAATFGIDSAQAIEVVVRVQDARPFANRYDIYFGGMTDLEYTITVVDTVTNVARQYHKAPNAIGGGTDRTSFPTTGQSSTAYALIETATDTRSTITAPNVTPAACVANSTTVCLLNGRFEVKVDFTNQFSTPPGAPGSFLGRKFVASTSANPDSAIFGISSADAIEVVVRLQDTRPFGLNRFDVYYGGMSDLEYTVTVTDKATGNVRKYRNPPNTVGGQVDRASFVAN